MDEAFKLLNKVMTDYYKLRIERVMQRTGRTNSEKQQDAILMERLFHGIPVWVSDNIVPEVWLNSGLLEVHDSCYYPVCPAASEAILDYGRNSEHMISLISALVGAVLRCCPDCGIHFETCFIPAIHVRALRL